MKKRMITAASVFAVALLLGGCTTSSSGVSDEITQADPWTAYSTLEEAEEEVGFEISVPSMSDYGSAEEYAVCAGLSEIEISYYDGSDESAFIRKANDDGDISGDYDEYAYEITDEATGVTLKGDSEDAVYMAQWLDGDYSYCIKIMAGEDAATMLQLAEGVE